MKITGIICELNPPHNGHQYLIHEVKKRTNCDFVIAIMSGDFVQRGTPAIYDYQTRAKMALNIGFDAIIYMPTAYSLNSADDFAKYGTQIANLLNLDYLAFGISKTESELNKLYSIISCESKSFKALLTSKLNEGLSYAIAFTYALEKMSKISNLSGNDILALQYIKNLSPQITPLPIKRISTISATNLRKLITEKNYTEIKNYVNEENYKIICEAKPLNMFDYETLLYHNIITKNRNKIKFIKSIKEGLENKISNEISKSTNFEDFNKNILSKRYNQVFLNRLYANILLDIDKNTSLRLPYIKIVAAKNTNILKYLKSDLPIVSTLKNKTLLCANSLYSVDQIACRIYDIIKKECRTPFPFHKLITY